jgi:alkylhydroperoxidase family enzyme
VLSFVARRFIDAFAKRYDYDAAYMQAMLTHTPEAFFKFAKVADASRHRRAAPAQAIFAAKLVGTVAEDCGPCTQLVVNMAREAGVREDQIAAVLERNETAMSRDTALGFRLADAVVRHSNDDDAARDAVRAAWGEKGVIELSLAVALTRVFPTLKAGMGYHKECRRVRVGARDVAVAHANQTDCAEGVLP